MMVLNRLKTPRQQQGINSSQTGRSVCMCFSDSDTWAQRQHETVENTASSLLPKYVWTKYFINFDIALTQSLLLWPHLQHYLPLFLLCLPHLLHILSSSLLILSSNFPFSLKFSPPYFPLNKSISAPSKLSLLKIQKLNP